MEDNTNEPKTAKFNVGGKEFETSYSLIAKQEGSMLARLVSETWLKNLSKPIFIDRSYDIFAFVLEYLRHGCVVLPDTISREMFHRDMDFYGINPGDGTVKASSFALQLAELKDRRDALSLADHCLRKLSTEERYLDTLNKSDTQLTFLKKDPFFSVARLLNERTEMKAVFKETLAEFGMTCKEIKISSSIFIQVALH
mmetsp:Transcript_24694/g.50577  ORF Transcript_24694/g.50577 Transcript_24694/m.50577 type:complete len:198 (+) Transcript_24694:55-648(+)